MKKLVRVKDGKLMGVCGGIAQYFGIDPTIVRIVWALVTFFTGCMPGIIAYIACAFIIPAEDDIIE